MQYINDTLFALQGNTTGYVHGIVTDPVPVYQLLGVSNLKGERTVDVSFVTERPVKDEWSRGVDWKRYGNLLGISSHLSNQIVPPANHEHGVSHPAFRGEIQDIPESLYSYSDPVFYLDYWGSHLDLYTLRPTSAYGQYQATGLNSQGFLTWNLYQDGGSPNLSASWFDNLMRVADFASVNTVDIQPIYYWLFSYSYVINTSYKRGNFWHVGLEYDFKRNFNSGGGDLFAIYHVKIDLDLWIVPHHGSNNPFDVNQIPETIFGVRDNSSVTLTSKGGVYTPNDIPPSPLQIRPEQRPASFSPVLQRDDSVLESRFFAFRRLTSRKDVNFLHRKLLFKSNDTLPDLRPSAFYSASDALQKHIEVLQANHLENLSQLSGLLSILPNLTKLPRIVSKLTKGDPSAIVEAIDYITDAIIKFRFAQSPTAGDTIELVTTDVLGELRSLLQSKSYTLYGQFFWEFPETENYMGDGRLVLGTRTKIEFEVDLSSLLATYLTANSMGILPTLSRTWAVIPFSFVVDWFTNMDDRLQAVDNQLLWLCLRPKWSLHSYTISYYPSVAMLGAYGLESPNPEEPFRVTAYFREFSLIAPLLRDSRFDFLAPNHGPDPLTVGALTWQKLRS